MEVHIQIIIQLLFLTKLEPQIISVHCQWDSVEQIRVHSTIYTTSVKEQH